MKVETHEAKCMQRHKSYQVWQKKLDQEMQLEQLTMQENEQQSSSFPTRCDGFFDTPSEKRIPRTPDSCDHSGSFQDASYAISGIPTPLQNSQNLGMEIRLRITAGAN